MPKPFLSVTYRSTSYPRPIENTDLLCHYLTNTVSQLPKDAEVFCLGDFKIDSLYFVLAAYSKKKHFQKKKNIWIGFANRMLYSPKQILAEFRQILAEFRRILAEFRRKFKLNLDKF